MLDCGDPLKMGFVQYRCLECGETRRIAFSCKSSFCLSCAKPHTERWVDFISRRLLPGVTYRHIVLTTPEFLRSWFLRHPDLLSALMRAGQACLQDVFQSCAKVEPLDIGSVVVLQTAGRAANYNPHLHILVTGGGLNPQGLWSPVSYIPFDLIHRQWQYYLLTMLRDNSSDPTLEKDVQRAWKAYPKGFVAFVEKAPVPPGGQGLARYLAKYVVSPPISVRRIKRYDGHQVSFWFRDHKTGNIEHLTLPVLEFIERMLQHILPKGFQRIRYYGLHCNVRYAHMRETLAALLPSTLPPDPRGYRVLPRLSFQQLFFETFDHDPLLCPRCQNAMSLELIQHPQYGILKDFRPSLYRDLPHEPSSSPALEPAQRVVHLSLPFV
jgi:hypothetical protein